MSNVIPFNRPEPKPLDADTLFAALDDANDRPDLRSVISVIEEMYMDIRHRSPDDAALILLKCILEMLDEVATNANR
jgi:hypothetical protein